MVGEQPESRALVGQAKECGFTGARGSPSLLNRLFKWDKSLDLLWRKLRILMDTKLWLQYGEVHLPCEAQAKKPRSGHGELLANVQWERGMIRFAFQSHVLPVKWRTDWDESQTRSGGRGLAGWMQQSRSEAVEAQGSTEAPLEGSQSHGCGLSCRVYPFRMQNSVLRTSLEGHLKSPVESVRAGDDIRLPTCVGGKGKRDQERIELILKS